MLWIRNNGIKIMVGLSIAIICHDLLLIPENYFLVTHFIYEFLFHGGAQTALRSMMNGINHLTSYWILGHLVFEFHALYERFTIVRENRSRAAHIQKATCSGIALVLILLLFKEWVTKMPSAAVDFTLTLLLTAPFFTWVLHQLSVQKNAQGFKEYSLLVLKIGAAIVSWFSLACLIILFILFFIIKPLSI